jgi:peptidoglycan-N-acetylglucosamine deacetylase
MWPAVAVGAGAAAVALYGAQVPTAQLYGPTIHRFPGARGRLALTFDDGPNPRETPRLLDMLDEFDAKATFFLIGRWAAREPELVREIVARGHAIGNHTYTHPTMPLHGAAMLRDDLARCRWAVERAGGTFSRIGGAMLMRPPYGRRRPGTLRLLSAEGYVPVTWSVTAYDWRSWETAERISRRCVRARDGDLILLHDGCDRDPEHDRSRSLVAARAALEHHTERGARFVTVPELANGPYPSPHVDGHTGRRARDRPGQSRRVALTNGYI